MRLMGALRLIDGDNMVEQVEVDIELSEGMEKIARSGERFEFAVAIVPDSAFRWVGPVINLDELYPNGVPGDPIFTEDLPHLTADDEHEHEFEDRCWCGKTWHEVNP